MGIWECVNRVRRGRVTFQHTDRNGKLAHSLAQLDLKEGDRVWRILLFTQQILLASN